MPHPNDDVFRSWSKRTFEPYSSTLYCSRECIHKDLLTSQVLVMHNPTILRGNRMPVQPESIGEGKGRKRQELVMAY